MDKRRITMKTILLLGANGQLGGDIVSRVASEYAADFKLIAWTREKLDVMALDQIDMRLGEISFDILINCTSYHKTDEVEANADKAVTINAHAVAEMAKACQKQSAILLHISTDYVFGGDVDRSTPLSEHDAPAPLNVYGATKLMGENLARKHHKNTIICRVASLFGVRGASGKGGNFIETMLRVAKEKGELNVVNDQTMSPTSTWDLADMLLKLLQSGETKGVYHAVNSGQASWYDFALEIIKQSGLNVPVNPVPTSAMPTASSRPVYSVMDNTKLNQRIGPIRTWKEALRDYLQVRSPAPAIASDATQSPGKVS
jgi:dTDP-4-dehydrorhamnose reductase